jgi:hypothetical protein
MMALQLPRGAEREYIASSGIVAVSMLPKGENLSWVVQQRLS